MAKKSTVLDEVDDEEEVETKKKKAKKPMMTFRMRRDAGPHFMPNKEFDPEEPEDEDDNLRDYEYNAGDIVKSREQLHKKFANKFILLSDPEERGAAKWTSGGEDDDEEDPDADRPVRSTEHARMKQRDRFLDDEELEGKPELLKINRRRKTKEASTEKLGDDVTDEYQEASDADFRVFRDGEGKKARFSISDGDEPGKPLKKGLKGEEVAAAIKELAESE